MKIDQNIKKDTNKDIGVILHDIRSVHNVGSIFRISDAIGVEKIYLTGYTPAPVDRFGKKRGDFSKVSLGSEYSVRWEQTEIKKAITDLKEKGFFVVSVEQSKNSLDYKKVPTHKKTVFIFGNETDGIPNNILMVSDAISEIKMDGKKESLNVSVTAGVVLFEHRDRF